MYLLFCRNWRHVKVGVFAFIRFSKKLGNCYVHSIEVFGDTYYMLDAVLGMDALYSIKKLQITTWRTYSNEGQEKGD